MLKLRALAKSYGKGDARVEALAGVDLDAEKAEFLVLTGPSGSGKTTLLNALGGMTRPDSGSVEINGKNIVGMSDAELAGFRARTLGYVFQFQSLMPYLSALENVLLPLAFARAQAGEEEALELLGGMGLGGREKAMPHELSAGQQRRVAIARALVSGPELLLCDEPTGDLDPDTEAVIMERIGEANRKGATVVLTTHNLELRRYAGRCLRLEKGSLLQD